MIKPSKTINVMSMAVAVATTLEEYVIFTLVDFANEIKYIFDYYLRILFMIYLFQ